MHWRGWEWCLVLKLLLLLETGIQGQPEYYVPALAGGNVNLSIPNLSGYTQFTWLFNSKMKIAELIINDSLTYFENEFKGRTCLHPDGILQIFNVQKEDSSIYILKLKDEKGVEESRKIQLEVFGPVPKPVLKLENIKNSGNYCFLNLSCVVSDPSVSYTWYEKNWHQLEHRHGVLEVTVNQQNYSDSYTCSVSNPVDNKTDTIRFTSFCMQAPSSGEARTATWLMVVLPIVLGLLLTRDECFLLQ